MSVDLSTRHDLVGDLLKLPQTRDEWDRYRLSDEQVAFYHEQGYLAGVRIKNQSCQNVVRRCSFTRMGRSGFDAADGKKNGEGVYIGTAPEQRSKNVPPHLPDQCRGNIVEGE